VGMLQESNAVFYHPLDGSDESLQSREWVFGATGDHAAGKLSQAVAATVGTTPNAVAEAEFTSANGTNYISTAVLDSSKFVVVYRNDTGAFPGAAKIGTVSGSDITFGAATEYDADRIGPGNAVAALSATKFVVAYTDYSDKAGESKIGTVSGTDITFGAEATFHAGPNEAVNEHVAGLDATHFVVVWRDDDGTGPGRAKIGTVSGTDITYGALHTFDSAATDQPKAAVLSATKFVVAYKDSSSYGQAKVGTVSGSDITFGSAHGYTPNTVGDNAAIALDASTIVVGWSWSGGQAKVGTVSGNDITFGPISEWYSSTVTVPTLAKLSSTSFAVTWARSRAVTIVGTVSGTDITWGTQVDLQAGGSATTTGTAAMSESEYVSLYRDSLDSYHGTAELVDLGVTADFSLRMGLEDFGSESEFHSGGSAEYISIGVISATKIVVAYQEASGNYHGKARVGTVSGTDITWGPESTFNATWTDEISLAVLDSTTIVVVYQDWYGVDDGESRVGTVSGTDITWGTEVEFLTGVSSTAVQYLKVAKLTSSKVVICFEDETDSDHGTAMIGTVSGTDITWGAQHEFLSTGGASDIDIVVIDSAKFVVTYKNAFAAFDGCARVGVVSGTDITFGAESTYYTGSGGSYYNQVVKLDSSRLVVAYRGGYDGESRVGTLSGPDITWGTMTHFLETDIEACALVVLSSTKVVVLYRDAADTDKGKGKEGTVSGTDITWGAAVNFLDVPSPSDLTAEALDNSYFVVGYKDNNDSYHGTMKVGQSLLDPYATTVGEERVAFCGWYKKPSV